MNIPEVVMGGLALLNAATVLVVMRSGVVVGRQVEPEPSLDLDASLVSEAASEQVDRGRSKPFVDTTARPVDDGLVELVEEADRLERIEAGRLRGEARLAADLGRWRGRGEDQPRAAGSCRTGTDP